MSIVTKEKKESAISVAAPQTGLFARQPLTVFGKITLWTSVVRALGGVAGLIPFVLAGSMSTEILTITLCSLAVIILLVAKFRWAPLVTILLEAYIIYVTFTTPETLYNLAHPYAPNDGVSLFITSVVAFAFSLLVMGGSIGATIENYRPTSRWLPVTFMSLIAGMIIGAMFIGFLSQPPVTNATAYTNGVPTVHMGAGDFIQPSVTLSKGSKLLLVDDSSVVHVLFNGTWQNGTPAVVREPGAPLVNSVRFSSNSVTIGPFAQAGTYHIFCTIHQGMTLTIIVQ